MNKKKVNLLFIIIFLLFISLRLAFITQKNLWFDEIFSWNLTLGSFYEILVRTSNDIHPPLFYFVLKIWNFIFGDSIFSMRFLSVIFSAGSLFFIYPISRRILDEKFAYVVVILFAVNPLNVFYSQEVRMSAMNLFLNAGSVYFLLKLTELNVDWKAGIKNKFLYFYILFRTLALYTHYFSFFILIVEIIIILFVLRNQIAGRMKTYLIAWGAVVILYLPWTPVFIEHITKGQSWRSSQYSFTGISSIPKELADFVKDINLGLYYHYTNLSFIYYITIFLVIIYVLAVILYFIKKESESLSLISFLLVFVPVILGLLLSLTQKVELYRYLSIIIPFVLIMTIYGISRVNNKFIEVPLILLLLAVNIYGLTLHYRFDFKNDDYRPIIMRIEKNFKVGDRIYVEPHYNGWVIDYYKKQWDLKLPNPAYIRYGWGEIQDSMRVQEPNRFWVIFDYSSVDTTKYEVNIKHLISNYKLQEKISYFLKPARVELYLLDAKQQ